ncbi:hypothetical protein EV05_0782 [Prochlorococcus sp. MIT 0601]|nr:hypothetical protein EV05_0782 [Prochlorococcus sp. MIT 0601]
MFLLRSAFNNQIRDCFLAKTQPLLTIPLERLKQETCN